MVISSNNSQFGFLSHSNPDKTWSLMMIALKEIRCLVVSKLLNLVNLLCISLVDHHREHTTAVGKAGWLAGVLYQSIRTVDLKNFDLGLISGKASMYLYLLPKKGTAPSVNSQSRSTAKLQIRICLQNSCLRDIIIIIILVLKRQFQQAHIPIYEIENVYISRGVTVFFYLKLLRDISKRDIEGKRYERTTSIVFVAMQMKSTVVNSKGTLLAVMT